MDRMRHDDLISALPFVRRYARALAGSQQAGDALVGASLKRLMHEVSEGGDSSGGESGNPRYRLYSAVTECFEQAGSAARQTAAHLSWKQRELLLLTQLEEVALPDAAQIVQLDLEQAKQALETARDRLREAAATNVLIIEDEPIIAMDIEELVRNCGHRVIGVASTEAEAVKIAAANKPGLILADINLGAGGDGTSAVARILRRHQAPVIFVTAYPERLLTGETVEPAFVITKPFDPMTLAIATYQAVTGGVHLD